MVKLVAQFEEITYSFSGVMKRLYLSDEDDEVRTTVSHRSVWQQVSTGDPYV